MKNARFSKYLSDRKSEQPQTGQTKAMRSKEEVASNPDNKIDQDFPGYPHGHANEETIKPKTKAQKETADVDNKDGEKRENKKTKKTAVIDEQKSDGSANAFEGK